MSHTLRQIIELVEGGEVRISEHGYDEMAEEGIFTRDIVNGIRKAELLEDYPNFPKGPCVLVMQKDRNGLPIHAVWGILKGELSPAVLVTAYRPDPTLWSDDLRRRKQ